MSRSPPYRRPRRSKSRNRSTSISTRTDSQSALSSSTPATFSLFSNAVAACSPSPMQTTTTQSLPQISTAWLRDQLRLAVDRQPRKRRARRLVTDVEETVAAVEDEDRLGPPVGPTRVAEGADEDDRAAIGVDDAGVLAGVVGESLPKPVGRLRRGLEEGGERR